MKKTLVISLLAVLLSACAAPTTIPSATVPETMTPSSAVADSPCWPTKSLNSENDIQGSLIFYTANDQTISPAYLDISSFKIKVIQLNREKSPHNFLISSDKNFLADLIENNLTLISSTQNFSVDLPLGDYFIDQFLTYKKILIVQSANRQIDSQNFKAEFGFTDVYYIYDPTTNSLTKGSVFLPKFIPSEKGFFAITYSPDMHYVLYHSSLPDEGNKGGFTLLDLRDQEVKWNIPESNRLSGAGNKDIPFWMPDANALTYAMFSNEEARELNFYKISLEGTIIQITQLEKLLGDDYELIFPQLSQWSSDAQYLAFRATISSLNGSQLLVWDNKEKKLLIPCLPVDTNASPVYGFDWSLDSKYVIVSLPYVKGESMLSDGPTYYAYRELLLDIPNKIIYELPNTKDIDEELVGMIGWVNWEIP